MEFRPWPSSPCPHDTTCDQPPREVRGRKGWEHERQCTLLPPPPYSIFPPIAGCIPSCIPRHERGPGCDGMKFKQGIKARRRSASHCSWRFETAEPARQPSGSCAGGVLERSARSSQVTILFVPAVLEFAVARGHRVPCAAGLSVAACILPLCLVV